MRLLYVSGEVYRAAIDAPNLPQHLLRHHLRYGPKEIRRARDETGKPRDPALGGDPESVHYVPRLRNIGGKIYLHDCRRPSRQPLYVPRVQEGQPIPKSRILFYWNPGSIEQ